MSVYQVFILFDVLCLFGLSFHFILRFVSVYIKFSFYLTFCIKFSFYLTFYVCLYQVLCLFISSFVSVYIKFYLLINHRFWAFSGAALLSILLFYWLYGGFFAFFLVCFGLSGVLYKAGDRLLYHPDQPPHSRVFIPTPTLFNMPFENLFIKAR